MEPKERAEQVYNVILDPLPEEWNGHKLDTDFRVGIQITMAMEDPGLSDSEKAYVAGSLLFLDPEEVSVDDLFGALGWFLNAWCADKHGKRKEEKSVMDFDIDQWRIYTAFKKQYGIDLNKENMHWFVFMGLLTNLEECAFTRIIEIRTKKIKGKMDRETKKAIEELQKVYAIDQTEVKMTEEQKQKDEEFRRLLGV